LVSFLDVYFNYTQTGAAQHQDEPSPTTTMTGEEAKAQFESMHENQVLTVPATISHIKASQNGHFATLSFRFPGSALTEEFMMNIFTNDIWRYFQLRLEEFIIRILRAIANDNATPDQRQIYNTSGCLD
jgi:hypothetical protein